MCSLNALQLESNSKTKINFEGGDLSSDSGLLLIKEFAHKFGFHKHVSNFKTDDKSNRRHIDDQSYENYRGYYEEDAHAIMDGIRNIGNPNRSQKTLLKPIYGVVNNAGSYMSPTASYNELKEYSNSVIQAGMTVYGGAKVLQGIGTAASGISYKTGQMSLANSMALSPGIITSVEAGVLLEGMKTSFYGSGILMAESMAGSGDSGGYIDKFGNVWTKGPSRTEGQHFEWDVQLSKMG